MGKELANGRGSCFPPGASCMSEKRAISLEDVLEVQVGHSPKDESSRRIFGRLIGLPGRLATSGAQVFILNKPG